MDLQQVKIFDTQSELCKVAPNTWTVNNAFGAKTLEWLQNIWLFEHNSFHVTRPHCRLMLAEGLDLNRIREIGASMVPIMRKIAGQEVRHLVSRYWIDLPGFGCQIHHDEEEILISYQVYLNEPDPDSELPCRGVEFLHVNPPVQIDMRPNYGYISLNTDLKLHQVVKGSGMRLSVMFQYSNVI